MRSILAAGVLCVVIALLPACHRKATARREVGAPPAQPVVRSNDTRSIRSVSISLHYGPDAKEPGDQVVARIMQGPATLGAVTLGQGERWAPGSVHAAEIRLDSALPLVASAGLQLELTRSVSQERAGRPWDIQGEALGDLNDGGEVRLLDLSPPARPTPGQSDRVVWNLAVR